MTSTSTTNPGILNLFKIPQKSLSQTINEVKNSGYGKIAADRSYERKRASQKKAWNDAWKGPSSSTPSQGSEEGESSESSSGSGISSLDDAAADSMGGGTGGADGTGGTDGTGGADGSGSSGSDGVSPLLQGEMTFEALVGEICNGIDLIFATKRTTVVVTDYSGIYAEAKYLRDKKSKIAQNEDIKMWQLEDGTYELDVSEYGFYTTVKVHYKNGTITESYDDLVRVYGEIVAHYYEPKIDKTTAIMKAKAYLAAHVRDFDLSVKANILWNAEIDIGDIVTIDNPLTLRDKTRIEKEKKDPEYFFVMGKSIEWEGEGPIKGTLDLRYGPKSPENKEMKEAGNLYSQSSQSNQNTDIQTAIDEVGKMAAKIGYSGECQTHDCVKSNGRGDCWGMSDYIGCELISRGVTIRIQQYPTSSSSRHRSVQYKNESGQWVNFPYREYGCNTLFNDTSGVNSSTTVKCTCEN